ncbi:alpha/beta hydrolase [Pseudonocardia sp. TRM90224]|uniref:alpha/beta hydrolase n=1 Tax=Pseudonocardia sp. TRM90224 TaxID=2812678 RepID=UPI001E5F6A87|nr:alpha/beta hydrolase-fold protein [Pseudonocardia sp. TRM90224]
MTSAVSSLLDLPLLSGGLPLAISLAGLAAAVLLAWPRDRRWWRREVPLVVGVAAAGAGATALLLNVVWRPFPDTLPARLFVWAGVAAAALLAAGLHLARRGRLFRLLAVPATVLVLATCGVKINAIYGYYPTTREALGISVANAVDLAQVPRPAAHVVGLAGWRPPPNLPQRGGIAEVQIPGTTSGFSARSGIVYLPPAALVPDAPRLPVLVLIAGSPGGPRDWLTAGRLVDVMDRFAAAHHGIAPVVVVPDATGERFANPLCMDSRRGNAETYLRRDVPDWAKRTLNVDPDPSRWAIAGFSYGGTCALQLAVRAPEVYPTFLDIGGQDEPSISTREQTIRELFDGDAARFHAVNPLDLLATRRYDGTSGTVVVGSDEGADVPRAKRLAEVATASGMRVRFLVLPGGHSWTVATAGLQLALPDIADRAGIPPSTSG